MTIEVGQLVTHESGAIAKVLDAEMPNTRLVQVQIVTAQNYRKVGDVLLWYRNEFN